MASPHSEHRAQRVDFAFEKVRNGAEVDPSISVFGVEAHAKILHLIAGSRHQSSPFGRHSIEGRHAQPRPGIGQGKPAKRAIGRGRQGLRQTVKRRG